MTNIGAKIQAARKRMGLTQEELAQRMGYKSKSTINKIELGINDIPQSKIAKFAEVLGTSPAVLMGWVDEKTSQKNDQIVELVAMLRREPDFFATVVQLAKLDPEQRANIQGIISALGKK